MKGQWKGTYSGTSVGSIVVNVDERSGYFEGAALIFPHDKGLPQLVAPFRTNSKTSPLELRVNQLIHSHPESCLPATWDSIKQHYPGVVNSSYADINCSWDNDTLKLSWHTDIGITGEAVLPRSKAGTPSQLRSEDMNWQEFKLHVGMFENPKYVFRGQNKPWRLRTAFHRTERAELSTFLNYDLPILWSHLSTRTKHIFKLSDPLENGAFYHLIQHHGYPTPLLDWTYSPFVAAFFAYRGISNEQAAKSAASEKVRIFVFDYHQWTSDFKQTLDLLTIQLHVSFGEFAAIENERMIPQQAISTLTNVDDVETYIQEREMERDKPYLKTIDLPVRDRKTAMRDLSFMGITSGSLFPGLDGTCEALKERNFCC